MEVPAVLVKSDGSIVPTSVDCALDQFDRPYAPNFQERSGVKFRHAVMGFVQGRKDSPIWVYVENCGSARERLALRIAKTTLARELIEI